MVVNLQFFGGRGSTSGLALTEKQAKKIEDSAQMKDTMLNGARLGAKFYEYTDSNGKKHSGETGAGAQGGTYRSEYSDEVARYAQRSTRSLENELQQLKSKLNDQYQRFARSAASKSASQVQGFADADRRIKMINQVLRRRTNKK